MYTGTTRAFAEAPCPLKPFLVTGLQPGRGKRGLPDVSPFSRH